MSHVRTYASVYLRVLIPALFVIVFFLLNSNSIASLTNSTSDSFSSSLSSSTSPAIQNMIIQNPTFLSIPKINVKANIQHIGKTQSGNMAVPNNFTDAGWYKEGSFPGDIGNAVIAGHVNNSFGQGAVFKKLDQLVVGDILYVLGKDGTVLTFKVTGTEVYEYDKAPIEKIFGKSDGKKLNLITCSGPFVSSIRTSSHRLVVYTELEV